ncbi:MAG: response regulator [Polyangia bacterium]
MARILLIDDSATVTAVVRQALEPDGHAVARLQGFVDLPSVLRDRPVDLILLDLQMPGFSGVVLGEFLQRYTGRTVPIVIYSGRPLDELRAAARQIGAAAALAKDCAADELRRLVNGLLPLPVEARAHR